MRATILAAVAAAFLFGAPAAHAAPTCLDKTGDTVRCGAAGAMPVGWTPSARQMQEWQASRAPATDPNAALKTICLVGLFLALIALMPRFDGSRGSDWDAQEGDDNRRR